MQGCGVGRIFSDSHSESIYSKLSDSVCLNFPAPTPTIEYLKKRLQLATPTRTPEHLQKRLQLHTKTYDYGDFNSQVRLHNLD